MQELIDYINQFVKLDSEAVDKLGSSVETEELKKNEYILEQGEYCNRIWFLKKGMVRKYQIIDGDERTCWIHTENDIFTSLISYSEQSQSIEYIQALQDSELISITRDKSKELSTIQPFQTFSNILMEKAFANIDKHSREFNSRDARGKYEYLGIIAPEVIKRAKLGHIASILGISQETLSRIRKG